MAGCVCPDVKAVLDRSELCAKSDLKGLTATASTLVKCIFK
jgi:hypothetical protein